VENPDPSRRQPAAPWIGGAVWAVLLSGATSAALVWSAYSRYGFAWLFVATGIATPLIVFVTFRCAVRLRLFLIHKDLCVGHLLPPVTRYSKFSSREGDRLWQRICCVSDAPELGVVIAVALMKRHVLVLAMMLGAAFGLSEGGLWTMLSMAGVFAMMSILYLVFLGGGVGALTGRWSKETNGP
jgi:hypothetical protein